jgi:hypothetical protein
MLRISSALTLLVLCGCSSGLEVSLQIQRGTDQFGNAVSTAALQTLTITFENEDGKDQFTIPINRDEQVELPALTVDKTKPFTVDVWGCATTPECGLNDVELRGCTPEDEPIDATERVDPLPITIRLLPANDETLERCPDP